MSPLHCLDTDVTNICSFFLNPMSEADASKVAIYSGADYSWNMTAFDSQTSWERAIYELVPEANEEFERFADNIGFVSEGSGFVFEESVYLKDDLDAFEVAVYSGEGLGEITETLKSSFEQIVEDADVLKNIEDQELLEEITKHLDAYKVLGQAGVALMEAYEAAVEGNIENCINKTEAARELLQDSMEFKVPVFEGGQTIEVRAYVGYHTLVPFMERSLNNVMGVLSANISGNREAKMLTNVEGLEVETVTVRNDEAYSVENISAAMNKGDYVAIALPKANAITEISAAVSPEENFKLQYSLNGIQWKDVEYETADGELSFEGFVKGAYVRLLCEKDNTAADLGSLTAAVNASKASEPLNPSITSDMNTYMDYNISNAIDGNFSTYYWTSHGSSVGNYVQIDFGTKTILNSVSLYSAINNKGVIDSFATTQLQVSENGATWINVGSEKSLSDYVQDQGSLYKLELDAGGVEARFFRLKAASNSESWLQLYELTWDVEHHVVERSISTNMGTYESYSIGKAMDGSMESKYYSNAAANIGDYVEVDLGEEISLDNATIFFGGNPNEEASAIDGFKSTKLQVSTDRSSWTDVGTVIENTDYNHLGEGKYAAVFKPEGVNARYVRFTAAEAGSNWIQVYEVGFNDLSFLEGTVNVGQGSYIDDGDISSAPVIYDVENGDTLIYPMTVITNAEKISFYQDSAVICNAAVSVQKPDGSWEEVGILDKTWNSFEIQDTILAVKLTFDGTADPVIYEIIVTEREGGVIPEEPELKEEVCKVFADVPHGAWYEDYVQYVYDNGLMAGSNGLFNPTKDVTRAQLVTTLYRLAGEPEVTDRKALRDFTDVEKGLYYTDAVCWAYNLGVGTGNDGKFNPTGKLTRQQMAAFLFRYAAVMDYDTIKRTDYSHMLNADQVSTYAEEAVSWAVGSGLISGSEVKNPDGSVSYDLKPRGNTTRAQLSAILQRFCGSDNE